MTAERLVASHPGPARRRRDFSFPARSDAYLLRPAGVGGELLALLGRRDGARAHSVARRNATPILTKGTITMPAHIQIGDITPRQQPPETVDGSTTVFSFSFPIFQDSDLEVFLGDQLQASGYSVAGAGDSNGGTVTFDTAPGSGETITLRRRLTIQRSSDFQESGEFRAKVINDELDFLTAAIQQVDDDADRALRLNATDPDTSLVLPSNSERAGKFLAFDDDGQPVASDAAGPQGPQGPPGDMDGSNNLSELTDAAAARSNLQLGTAATANVAAGGGADLLRQDGDGSGLSGISGIDAAARANVILNAFRIAVSGGLSVQNMVDGVVDEFEDETGVTTKTGATYDATGDYYHNPGATPADMILQSNACAAEAQPNEAFLVVWQEDVDGVILNTDLLAYVSRHGGTSFTTNFVTDDKLAAIAHGLSNDDRVTVSTTGTLPAGLDSSTVYHVVNAATDDFEVSPAQGGAATDITGDGAGTHSFTVWSQAMLEEEASLSTGRILAKPVAISAQPSGTSMSWKITTHNNKELRLHGVGLEWS